MKSEATLIFGMYGGQSDLAENLGFVVLEEPAFCLGEAKGLAKVSFPDEDGDEVYIPQSRKIKSKTMEVRVGCTGKNKGECINALAMLEICLLEAGAINVYSQWMGVGYAGCSYGGSKDAETCVMSNEEIMTVTLIFEIHEPKNFWDPYETTNIQEDQ